MSEIKSQVCAELDTLIERGRKLDSSFQKVEYGVKSSVPEAEHRAFITASLAAIARVAGRDSEYFECAPKQDLKTSITSGWVQGPTIPAMLGALMALREAVGAGLLQSLETRLRANVHDDFLEQAKQLDNSGYHVAAMVLAGGVLEDHLKKLCQRQSLTWSGSGSLSKYNDLLRDVAYPQPTWRRIQAIGDVRNHAAHGEGDQVAPADVADAMQFISRLIADYPA